MGTCRRHTAYGILQPHHVRTIAWLCSCRRTFSTGYRWQVTTSHDMRTQQMSVTSSTCRCHGSLPSASCLVYQPRRCLEYGHDMSFRGLTNGLASEPGRAIIMPALPCEREEALWPAVLKGLYTAIKTVPSDVATADTGLIDRRHGDLSFFLASPAFSCSCSCRPGLTPRVL